MRLTDLDPKWVFKDGRKIGFTFVCPTTPDNPMNRQSCLFEKIPRKEQWDLLDEHEPVNAEKGTHGWVQGCNPDASWTWNGKDFDALTVTPSIDGSKGGNWHGFITDGAIVGGL